MPYALWRSYDFKGLPIPLGDTDSRTWRSSVYVGAGFMSPFHIGILGPAGNLCDGTAYLPLEQLQ